MFNTGTVSGDDDDFDADGIVFGTYHKLSDRTRIWGEATQVSADGDNVDAERTQVIVGLRHDF